MSDDQGASPSSPLPVAAPIISQKLNQLKKQLRIDLEEQSLNGSEGRDKVE